MDSSEIFDRLVRLRLSIIDGRDGEPLDEVEKAVLWDAAIALGLSGEQAGEVAGDPPQLFAAPEPDPETTVYDFSESGLGIGRIGDADLASEALAELEAVRIVQEQARRDPHAHKLVLCSCGHYDAFPMSTARGSACVDCYDRMSD